MFVLDLHLIPPFPPPLLPSFCFISILVLFYFFYYLFQCFSLIFICSTLIPPFPPPLLPSCIFTAPRDKGLNLWHKVKDIRGEHQADNRAPPPHLFVATLLFWRLKLFRWKWKSWCLQLNNKMYSVKYFLPWLTFWRRRQSCSWNKFWLLIKNSARTIKN